MCVSLFCSYNVDKLQQVNLTAVLLTHFTMNKNNVRVPICKMFSDVEKLLIVKNSTTTGFIYHLGAQHTEQQKIVQLPSYPHLITEIRSLVFVFG